MTKNFRHKTIKDIITKHDISSQEILLNALVKNGFDVTQATLSRDIKELKIIKTPVSNGSYAYRLPQSIGISEPDEEITASALKFNSIDFSGQLAVAKTRPGFAMAIAAEIDKKASDFILGTIAGDDTILLIPKESLSRGQILESLKQFINK